MISFQTIKDKFSGWLETDDNIRRQTRSELPDLVGSSVGSSELHRVAIDIDFPIEVHPSRSPGHFHLYFTGMQPISWDKYEKLLDVLVECGILEPGYVSASKVRKNTFLRARPDVVLVSDIYDEPLTVDTSEVRPSSPLRSIFKNGL